MQIPTDPFVLELLPEFIDVWIDDVKTQLVELIQSRDAEKLYRFGHTMKGSCAQFGLSELSAMGAQLMGYAKNGGWDDAGTLAKSIADKFFEAKQFVEQHISGE